MFSCRVDGVFLIQVKVHEETQDRADDEQDDGDRTGHTVVLAVQVVVQIHDDRRDCSVRSALAVCQDLRHIEHLETADHGSDQNVDQDRTNHRKRDLKECLCRRTSVKLCRLEEGRVNAHDGRHQQDRGVTEPHQEVHQRDQSACTCHGGQETERLFQDAHIDQCMVDWAVD